MNVPGKVSRETVSSLSKDTRLFSHCHEMANLSDQCDMTGDNNGITGRGIYTMWILYFKVAVAADIITIATPLMNLMRLLNWPNNV